MEVVATTCFSHLFFFQHKRICTKNSIVKRKCQDKGANVKCMVLEKSSAAEEAKRQSSSVYVLQTLTSWLLKQEQDGVIDAELTIVLSSISMACKLIASLVQRAGISKLTGEEQKKLDVVSNEVFSNCMRASGRTGIIASEEEHVPVAVEESYYGNYIVVFDPLDGSSNIDAAVSTGSIFGIYTPNDDLEDSTTLDNVEQRCIANVCQPGNNLLAAGYCMYSSSMIFVLTLGNGVYSFTLDPMFGEFILTQKNIQIPNAGKIYAFNEGNYQLWDDRLKKYIDHLKDPVLLVSLTQPGTLAVWLVIFIGLFYMVPERQEEQEWEVEAFV